MNKHVVNLVKSVEGTTYTMIGTSRYLVTYGPIKAVKMGMESRHLFTDVFFKPIQPHKL